MIIQNQIENMLIESRTFVWDNRRTIQIGEEKFDVYPEYRGKTRVTEWGGTSAAVSLLGKVGIDSHEMNMSVQSSIKWLEIKQVNGAWNAAEMYRLEATCGVLLDLLECKCLSYTSKNNAIFYIKSCFDEKTGCFYSTPEKSNNPHIYSTFLAIKALYKTGQLDQKISQLVSLWIIKSKSLDGMWGIRPKVECGTISHTVYALMTLFYCGYSVQQIKQIYIKQIKWLKSKINVSQKLFEEEHIPCLKSMDEDGKLNSNLRTYHFSLIWLFDFFYLVEDKYAMMKIYKNLYKMFTCNGWGKDSEHKFVWATDQAVGCIIVFRDNVLSNMSLLIRLSYSIRFFWIKLILSILLFLLTILWIRSDIWRVEDIILAFIPSILPWLFKRND